MSFLSGIFSKTKTETETNIPVLVDMHSHLIPGIDDGSENIEDSYMLVKELSELGYTKIITTPHIMGDFFKNSAENILPKLEELKKYLAERNILVELEAAAEYYLDEWFMEKLKKNQPLLSFGGAERYLLFETSYINSSAYLDEAIFTLKSLGYKPVLAHPERYMYLQNNIEALILLKQRGVLYQININSLAGYYNKGAQLTAEKLIDHNMVDMIGTDCHGIRHVESLKKAMQTKYYKKVIGQKLLNNSLLG